MLVSWLWEISGAELLKAMYLQRQHTDAVVQARANIVLGVDSQLGPESSCGIGSGGMEGS